MANNEDFYTDSAKHQLERLDSERAQANADLQNAKAQGDYDSAAYSVQAIANIEAQKSNLLNLHNQYVQSQQPPARIPLTAEEFHAIPAEKMSWDHGLHVARQSKYGRSLNWNDPNVAAGYREAIARRGRGE